MDTIQKIVHFHEWCNKCKNRLTSECDDPCNECLTYPMNENSHKPVNFKENKGEK